MQVRKQQLELDMEQQIGSKLGKECVKAVYCHPAYLTYMQSTSWEMLDWKKHKLENSARDGHYQTTWPASWEIHMQVRKQQLELDMEQQIGSK